MFTLPTSTANTASSAAFLLITSKIGSTRIGISSESLKLSSQASQFSRSARAALYNGDSERLSPASIKARKVFLASANIGTVTA